MLTGLLRPKPTDTNPWLFPVSMASRRALHSDEERRRWLYPRRTIWLDASRADTDNRTLPDGDGTHARPLRNWATLFADDTLACVCNHLCADHIPVRIRGPVQWRPDHTDTGTITLVDGNGRDYNRRLLLRPWADGTRLRVTATLKASALPEAGRIVTISKIIRLVTDLHGVRWKDTDFHIMLLIDSPPPEDLSVNLQVNCSGELGALYDCQDNILQGCTVEIICRVVAMNRNAVIDDIDNPPPEFDPDLPGGGSGDGTGGDGSGSDAGDTGNDGGTGTYPWPGGPAGPKLPIRYPWPPGEEPEEPEEPRPTVTPNATALVYGAKLCHDLIGRDIAMSLLSVASSNAGAIAGCYGLFSCHDGDLENLTIACSADARVTAFGKAIAGGGIADYSMLAESQAAGTFAGPRCTYDLTTLTASAKAFCTAGNQPFSIVDGVSVPGVIGGQSTARSFGIAGNTLGLVSNTSATVSADASHPWRWLAEARPYSANRQATLINATGTGLRVESRPPLWAG